MDTVKSLNIDPDSGQLPFVVAIIKKSMNRLQPSWDITLEALDVMSAFANNPGKILHALDALDPQDGELITLSTVRQRLPNLPEYASDYLWEKMWDGFKDKDQRRVFKTGSQSK